jgi:hypothetical protein
MLERSPTKARPFNILARKKASTITLSRTESKIECFHLIVPIFCEHKNGNLARMVGDLEKQGHQSKLNLIFVVNNSREEAANSNSSVREENQATLLWLKEQSFSFSHQVIDLSSSGIDRNMGIIRQAGVEAISSWANSNPTQHICVHLDADTHIPPTFLEILHDLYSSYESLDTVFFMRDYEIRHQPSTKLLFSHQIYRSKRALSDFFNTRATLPYGVATYQISSRYSALTQVGGFKPLIQGEDSALSHDLANTSNWIQTNEIVMRTEDRDRKDGFTSAKRLHEIDSMRTKKNNWRRFLDFLRGKLLALESSSLMDLRSASMRPFLINFQLFHPLCVQIFTRVQSGEITYSEAVEFVRLRMEKVLLRPVKVESHRFFSQNPEEFRKMTSYVELWHRRELIKLNPVAHAFPDLILTVSTQPGTDLWSILKLHLPSDEITLMEQQISSRDRNYNFDLEKRIDGLEQLLLGKEIASRDPFILWCKNENTEIERMKDDIASGKKTVIHATNWLKDIFSDWLAINSPGNYTREADTLQLIVSLLIRSRTSVPSNTAMEDLMALLQDGPNWVGKSDLY